LILDAGCGNRAMWQFKDAPIITCDIEKNLQKKPLLFASNTHLPFKDGSFSTVFFDPPFAWNIKTHPFFSYPNKQLQAERGYKVHGDIPTYYGIERYKTRSELIAYIYRAEKEINRVLKPEGSLWLRWCEMKNLPANNILSIFNNWHICLEHEINSSKQVYGTRKSRENNISHWFMLMKKPLKFSQQVLPLCP
jgi:hypothetical protein